MAGAVNTDYPAVFAIGLAIGVMSCLGKILQPEARNRDRQKKVSVAGGTVDEFEFDLQVASFQPESEIG